MYNILILNLYLVCLSTLEKDPSTDDTDSDSDVFSDLRVQEQILFSKLDPSIRYHIRKVGISVVKNTYIGFDTEYNNVDFARNSLVSAQLAISSKVYVKIPKALSYSISSLDIERNKLQSVSKVSDKLNYSKIESSIQ